MKEEEPQKYVELRIEAEGEEEPASWVDEDSFRLVCVNKGYKLRTGEPGKWVQVINDRYYQLRIQTGM